MAELPSGTVTFLFTDIEGSTARWERQTDEMSAALSRHDTLLRTAIEAHGGVVFKTVGDAFYAVFTVPADALAAAVAAQRALVTEAWNTAGDALRVRMGLHTGVPVQRDADYFGQPLNRVARLMASGHGGQVLLSLATAELTRDALPDGASLRDLGEARLKDLQRPEHIFQLVLPDLPADFPPLKTLDLHPHNLPVHPTPLLGRDKELAAVTGLLRREEVRLVTLAGPGGIGKTRLALQVAAELSDDFADGVFFVGLASVTEPRLVISTIAQTRGVRDSGERSAADSLIADLRDKRLLLLLDNLEQVTACSAQLAELLAASPGLKLLCTSRIALRLRGEKVYRVPPLALPTAAAAGEASFDVSALSQYAAVALFIERALDADHDFTVTNATAPAIAEICARLDGLPLAIELAAARVRVLSPQALLARLSNRLKLLTGGARDLPARQQTLRNTIAWSYDLLEPAEQILFRRLAVFGGGCTLDAIEAVCGAADGVAPLEADPLDALGLLMDKSLVRQQDAHTSEDEPRFTMLETIREYGLDQLAASGEHAVLRSAHLRYFLALAEQAEPQLRGPEQGAWMERLEREHDNLRAALTWARVGEPGEPADVERGLRLAGALWRFWFTRGYLREGRDWLESLLGALGDVQSEGSAQSTVPLAVQVKALHGAGTLATWQGEYDIAVTLLEAELTLAREIGDAASTSSALNNLGVVALWQSRLDRAAACFEEAVAIHKREGSLGRAATALENLAETVYYQGDLDRATALVEEALPLFQQVGDAGGEASVLCALGHILRSRGHGARAAAQYRAALELRRDLGDSRGMVECLEGLGMVMASDGQAERGARLLSAAASIRQTIGFPVPPQEQPPLDLALAALRASLTEERFAAAWEQGRVLTAEQAIADCLNTHQPS